MKATNKLGMVAAVVAMVVAIPVGAAALTDDADAGARVEATKTTGANGDVFDIFLMSPEQFVNALNGAGGAGE